MAPKQVLLTDMVRAMGGYVNSDLEDDTQVPSTAPITTSEPLPESNGSSSESDGSTSSAEETDDQPVSPRSNDGQDKKPDGSPKNDPDASSSAVASTTRQPFQDFTDETYKKEIDELIKEMDEENLKVAIAKNMSINKFYYDLHLSLKKALRKTISNRKKQERENKKKEEKQEEALPEDIVLTVRFNEETYTVSVPYDCTFRGFRNIITVLFPKVFVSQKMTKGLRYIFKNQDLSEHSRREFGSGKKGSSGWRMSSGDVITILPRGLGGGKRAMSAKGSQSRDDAIQMLKDEVDMAIFRINSHKNMSPIIDGVVQHVVQLKQSLTNDTFKVDEMLNNLTVKELQRLITAITSNTRPDARFKAVADIVLGNITNNVVELTKQSELSKKLLTSITQLIFITKMSDDYSNIGWSSFLNSVSESIKTKVSKETSTKSDVNM